MSYAANKASAIALMEALDTGNVEGVLAHCAPSAIWHGFGPQALDSNGYRQAIGVFLSAFSDLRFPIEAVVAEEERVAIQHSLRGTHNGDFQGVPPTGKSVTVSAMVIFKFANGKVIETWLNADMLGLLAQVGAIPAPV